MTTAKAALLQFAKRLPLKVSSAHQAPVLRYRTTRMVSRSDIRELAAAALGYYIRAMIFAVLSFGLLVLLYEPFISLVAWVAIVLGAFTIAQLPAFVGHLKAIRRRNDTDP